MHGSSDLKRGRIGVLRPGDEDEDSEVPDTSEYERVVCGVMDGPVVERIHAVKQLEKLMKVSAQVCKRMTPDLLMSIVEIMYDKDEEGYSPLVFLAYLSAVSDAFSGELLRATFATMFDKVEGEDVDHLLDLVSNLLCDCPELLQPEFCRFLQALPVSRRVARTWEIIMAKNGHARADFGMDVLRSMVNYLRSCDRDDATDVYCIRTFVAMIDAGESARDDAIHVLVKLDMEKPILSILKSRSRALKYCLCLIRKAASLSPEFVWQLLAFDIAKELRCLIDLNLSDEINRELILTCTALSREADNFPGTLFDDLAFFDIFSNSSFEVKIALLDFLKLKLDSAPIAQLQQTITPDFIDSIIQLSESGMDQAKECAYHFIGWFVLKSQTTEFHDTLIHTLHESTLIEQLKSDELAEQNNLAQQLLHLIGERES